ncbi:HAD-IIB family hydrolase [Flavilitoribacter nigricans]|uniref:Helicase HerA central domain-containing protein n=1 Tax=Flavilitoribacter nigricans (strain ATCC 23147 / DSM 23189 / NBRC 102662 / NCIMB 1420 / SS-2) TaxID=1122177 RepID=A0A2D0NI76_FLAN2|nr:HAD-IIB family hydrolase [Flavilitoribacter nigricans]PHN08212.1 hypothetical protein CRP01_02505 [Flavilitoribacter nigricans DSM 23189 = NBRC 102662]
MHLNILALDLDGTLAKDGIVADETWQALRNMKAAGFVLILVTGRRLSVIPGIGPFDEICEAVIAENGATIYFPRSDTTVTPFGRLAPEVIQKLEGLGREIEFGVAIAATWIPHDREVLHILSDTGYAATVEYNKGAVMILPPGATKGSGLKYALEELGYSTRNVIACGDAENDRSMFEQADLSVAVANAIPAIRDLADTVLNQPNGAGSRQMMGQLLAGKIPPYRCRPQRRIQLGQNTEGDPVCLSPFNLLDSNWGIVGSSGTGKSWLAGMIMEQLLRIGYQVCVIDPEGDYRSIRAFPRTIVLGSDFSSPPSVGDVITLLEYARVSIILDLTLYKRDEKITYVREFMQALSGIRAKRGLPHWFLIDEAHYFCHTEGEHLSDLFLENAQRGGFTFVTYYPDALPKKLLQGIDHWMFTQINHQATINVLRKNIRPQEKSCDLDELRQLNARELYLCLGDTPQLSAPASGIVRLDGVNRSTQHVRHLHKYLLAPLPTDKQFYFHVSAPDPGVRPAASLWEFRQALPKLPVKTIKFHLERHDFEKWLTEVIHDDELARQVRKLAGRPVKDEQLKEALAATVANRFDELESLI